jgi:hypothetical protein
MEALYSDTDMYCRGIQIAAKKGLKVIAIDRYVIPKLETVCLYLLFMLILMLPKWGQEKATLSLTWGHGILGFPGG